MSYKIPPSIRFGERNAFVHEFRNGQFYRFLNLNFPGTWDWICFAVTLRRTVPFRSVRSKGCCCLSKRRETVTVSTEHCWKACCECFPICKSIKMRSKSIFCWRPSNCIKPRGKRKCKSSRCLSICSTSINDWPKRMNDFSTIWIK